MLEDTRHPSKLGIKKDEARNHTYTGNYCEVDIMKGKSVYVSVGGYQETSDEGDLLKDVWMEESVAFETLRDVALDSLSKE